jgi:hypothetical protein
VRLIVPVLVAVAAAMAANALRNRLNPPEPPND